MTTKKLNTEQFIEKANKIHNFKYDYSLTHYVNMRTNIDYICPKHGVSEQVAQTHLNGSGCNQCSKTTAISNQEFIKQVSDIHENIYDYSITEFKNLRTPIKYMCAEHGVIEQSSRHHLDGFGCSRCSR